jgi:protein TonB
MTSLVDTKHHSTGVRLWSRRLGVALLMLGFVGLVVWIGTSLSHGPAGPHHQAAKIALLPDTPPPPPPPPPERPKIEPKTEAKQQLDKKIETPPEPQQLKMEGAAGDGPSPFAAGEVKNDYIGGDIGNGAQFAAYAGRVAQLIQEELARRNVRVPSARIFLWLRPDGAIERYEIRGLSGDPETKLRSVMAALGRVPEAPAQDLPMPMGLEISER